MRLNSELWGKNPQSSNFLKTFLLSSKFSDSEHFLRIRKQASDKQINQPKKPKKKTPTPNKNIQPNKYTKQKYIFWIPNSASIFLKIFCLLRFFFFPSRPNLSLIFCILAIFLSVFHFKSQILKKSWSQIFFFRSTNHHLYTVHLFIINKSLFPCSEWDERWKEDSSLNKEER